HVGTPAIEEDYQRSFEWHGLFPHETRQPQKLPSQLAAVASVLTSPANCHSCETGALISLDANARRRYTRSCCLVRLPAGPEATMTEVTQILSAIEGGDPHAAEQLLPLVYAELRRLAAQRLARESPGQTLEATALVHEAYLRLVDVDKAQHWNSRG